MVSMECDLSPEANRARMDDYIIQIMSEGPDVRPICFGETMLGWYWKGLSSAAYHKTLAEPNDGAMVTLMKKPALDNNVYISFGFTEEAGENIYNAVIIIDNRDEIIAHRHKSDFVPYDTLSGFTAGEKIVTTAYIDTIKAAFLICNDFNNKKFQEQIKADPEIKLLMLPHL